ncbi:hypothetical protein AJ80_06411 [Polytolypa hystricis UAMH7299]|uniref:PD-(D/E)XK nuclease-like domain-containing protein n=1 Tax=Polytolypa hystricis (strain UAMH7299) TaxID=1447883 RepID=A0A2B7XW36_POLH7|nr:hypothetical protein AJ80_06411 [Polytolypa hystricis UAMH7299]
MDSEEKKTKEVQEFMRQLVDRVENPLPTSLRSRLRAQKIGDDHGQHDDATPEEAKLRDSIEEIMEDVNEKLGKNGDETAWTEVVTPLLELIIDQRGALFETMQVQAVSISPQSLIPAFVRQPFAFKKVNIAVFLSDSRQEIQRLYVAIQKRHPLLLLSQSEDATVGHFFQFAALEVKSPDGSYYGASVQFAIWLAAGLEKMRQLKDLAGASSSGGSPADQLSDPGSHLPLYPGIAVVVQAWYLHLAAKAMDGTVAIYAPWLIGDTTNRWGIFRIVAALEALRSWGEAIYYPWLRDHIMMPLASEMLASDQWTTATISSSAASGVVEQEGQSE